jgi:hypothetical protein
MGGCLSAPDPRDQKEALNAIHFPQAYPDRPEYASQRQQVWRFHHSQGWAGHREFPWPRVRAFRHSIMPFQPGRRVGKLAFRGAGATGLVQSFSSIWTLSKRQITIWHVVALWHMSSVMYWGLITTPILAI